MKEQIQKKLNDSKVLRWSVLALVAFTMLCGYFLTDVMSPLKPMLEKELLWDSLDYGIFTSAYGWFNVFAFMLIIGGIILDKMGVRFTGMGACLLMVLGCGLKYYATVPIQSIVRHSNNGAGILGWNTPSSSVIPKKVAIGTVTAKASIVPKRAVAISIPMARAISFPLNHFTIIFETVMPAISTPTPNIAYPNAASPTWVFIPSKVLPSANVVEIA
jgi:hypothetical protein